MRYQCYYLLLWMTIFQVSKVSGERLQNVDDWKNVIHEAQSITETNPQKGLTILQAISSEFHKFPEATKVDFLLARFWIYFRIGEYEDGFEDLSNALPISQSIENYSLGEVYLNLGHLYCDIDSLDLGKDYYRLALQTYLSASDTSGVIPVYDGLGQVHQYFEDYDSAKYYMELGRALSTATGDSSNYYNATANYATVLFETGEIDEAIRFQNEVFDWEARMRDSVAMIFSYANLCRYHLERDEQLAYEYKAKAFNLAERLDSRSTIQQLHYGYSLIEERRGNFEKALEHHKTYHDLTAEIMSDEMLNRAKEWEITQENQQKDFEIGTLQELNRMQDREQRLTLLGLAFLMTVFAVVIWLFFQLRKNKRELEDQKEELEQVNQTKDKFFSIIAHDLRGPMIGLQGTGDKLDYFLRKGKKDKLLDLGTKVDSAINQLNHLLNNLLNWAASQTNSIPYAPEHIVLRDLIQEIKQLYGGLTEVSGVSINTDGVKGDVYADRNTTATIFRNLISNAIKFSPNGSEVTLKTEKHDDNVVVIISDDGQGMESEMINAINRRIATSSPGKRGEKGFGLGLKLCNEFARLNYGSLSIISEPGEGTTIRVALPQPTP